MVNKKLLMSFLLVLLVAVSIGSVSAADDIDNIVADQLIIVDGDDDVAVTDALDLAEDGAIIDLGMDKNYTFNSGIEIYKNVTLIGENVTINADGSQMPDGVIQVYSKGSGTVIQGITFYNTDDPDNYLYKYNGMIDNKGKSVKTAIGIAINLYAGADDVQIDDCTFINWYDVGVSVNRANNVTIRNSYFTGGSATFINDIPDGPEDRGTYHISVISSTGTNVISNYFADTVCDGVFVAGSSYYSTIIGNTFEDNAFSIYFGGESNEGTLIAYNDFINCGWFESDVYDEYGETGEYVEFYDLPVISVQKSSDSFEITENIFYARNGNVLIKALEGSTAHGSPSNIGSITVTYNEIYPYDWYYDVFMPSVTLLAIETNNEVIRPIGEIEVADNELNGAKSASYWSNTWGDTNGDVFIKSTPSPTGIFVSSIVNGTITAVLKDYNDVALSGETIDFTSKTKSGSVKTDKNGVFTIKGVTGLVTMTFEGNAQFSGSECTVDVPGEITKGDALISVYSELVYGGDGEYYVALENAKTGEAVNNADLEVNIDGDKFYAVTDDDGVAVFTIEEAPGDYTAIISFEGNDNYNPTSATVPVTVSKITTAVSVYYDNATNELVATLVNTATNKAISGAGVVFNVNGAKTSVKTNKQGEARFALGDSLPASASVKYAGNSKYLVSTATAKIAESKVPTVISNTYDKESEQIVATVTNVETGKGISGATVVFNYDGAKVSVKTDKNGQAVFSVEDSPSQAIYTIGSSYGGNSKYSGTSANIYFVKT